MSTMSWVWMAVMLLCISTEIATVSITSLWFAMGALVALIASVFYVPPVVQAVLFVSVSGASLWLLRPVVKKYFTPKLTRTNVDAIIGTEGIVTEEINNLLAVGTVKLAAMQWSARSSSGDPIAPGTRIKVDRIEGVKVYVTPVEDKITQEVSL